MNTDEYDREHFIDQIDELLCYVENVLAIHKILFVYWPERDGSDVVQAFDGEINMSKLIEELSLRDFCKRHMEIIKNSKYFNAVMAMILGSK